MKAVGQFAGGIAAYDAGKYTRSVMNVNAQNVQNAGVSQREQIRYNARMAMGQQVVAGAGNGFSGTTGSPLDALRESLVNRELDIATSRRAATMQAQDFTQKGKLAYAQGKAAEAGGILSGVETIASTAAQAAAGAGGGGDASIGMGTAGGSYTGPAPDLSSNWSLSPDMNASPSPYLSGGF